MSRKEDLCQKFIFVRAPSFILFQSLLEIKMKSTYAKVHGSVSVDALQRKEAEQSACGKVHDPALKITEIYFQENYYIYVTFWWKMEITDLLGLILEMSIHNFVEIFLE